MTDVDILIVGAGPVGCVIAERAASQLGWSSIIVEKRDHIAGNCYDRLYESGVLIHEYGPHYFRTNSQELLAYLSTFTEWIPGNYIVQCHIDGKHYPFPINLDTLEQFFGKTLTEERARELLESEREKIEKPKNSEEFVLSRVGSKLYDAFYLGYTIKQWNKHPRELDPSVCGRIPIRFNRDNRYVDQKFQVTPDKGFTAMFDRMIDHPLITVRLSTEYKDVCGTIQPKRATVYCGPIDAYFDFKFGKLPWRSLRFDLQQYDQEYMQPCVQINYPNDFEYTRSVEIKHVTQQKHQQTIVTYEYPRAEGDPYYPIPAPENRKLYEEYEQLANEDTRRKRVYFAGRLATYRYINTDQAIEEALQTFERIKTECQTPLQQHQRGSVIECPIS